LATLLATRAAWWGVVACRRRSGRGAGLGPAAKELLLAESQLGTERFDLLLEKGLALNGAIMHGLPVAGLSPGLKLVGQARADGTGAVREGRCRAGGGGRRAAEWHAPRVRANRAGKRSCHAKRYRPEPSAGQPS